MARGGDASHADARNQTPAHRAFLCDHGATAASILRARARLADLEVATMRWDGLGLCAALGEDGLLCVILERLRQWHMSFGRICNASSDGTARNSMASGDDGRMALSVSDSMDVLLPSPLLSKGSTKEMDGSAFHRLPAVKNSLYAPASGAAPIGPPPSPAGTRQLDGRAFIAAPPGPSDSMVGAHHAGSDNVHEGIHSEGESDLESAHGDAQEGPISTT